MLRRRSAEHPRELCPKLDMEGQQGRTHREFKDDTDINNIVKRFIKTGEMPSVKPGAFYGDFGEIEDFAGALDEIERIEELFSSLPSDVRRWADNDPRVLIERAERGDLHEFFLSQTSEATSGSEDTANKESTPLSPPGEASPAGSAAAGLPANEADPEPQTK